MNEQRSVSMPTPAPGRFLDVNGASIHHLDIGAGPPVVVLHGGSASNHPLCDESAWGWNAHLQTLSQTHRVIAPDLRGHAWTVNSAGEVSYDMLAADLGGLIRGLGLERPPVIGFSDGGVAATILSITEPEVLGPLVNIAGYDLFDPGAPSMGLVRRWLGGSDHATEPDLDRLDAAGGRDHEVLLLTHDAAQGPGAWRRLFVDAFRRWTSPIGYAFEDLDRVGVPTLIMAGDRDVFCRPEDSVRAYRSIRDAELAVIPGAGHVICAAMIPIALDFIARRQA